MGILAASVERDVEALYEIAELSKSAWLHYREQTSDVQKYDVDINDGTLPAISELGGTILNKHFADPTFLDRIAIFVVLANCCPFFKLQHNKKVVMDMHARRTFVAKMSCTFVQGALRKFAPTEGSGYYQFDGFADPSKQARFITFLEFMDGVEIKNTATGVKKDLVDHALKTFAKDAISVVTFIESEIKFIPDGGTLISGSGE